MTLTAGALSQTSVTPTTAALVSAAATSGTAPYTYQWYRSTTSGFTPGAGNLIAGATSLTLNDTGLIPNTTYFYAVKATDSVAATANSAQLTVVTQPPTLQVNAFAQSTYVGRVDMRQNSNVVACLVDVSQATPLYAGALVKVVDSPDGVPKVVGCAANNDEAIGVLCYDVKSVNFQAGQACEVAMENTIVYLYATTAVSRMTQVTMDLSTNGGVAAKVTGNKLVGYAFDKASAPGALIRVVVKTPSYTVAP